jgi:rhodanese-related sulfurtransferase/DNA-binding transcriptional ArsR family regulator
MVIESGLDRRATFNYSFERPFNWPSRAMSTQSPKQLLFGQFAAVAKCLSHPHRIELLEQLAQGERSVEILAQKVGLSTANASQHLRSMLRVGMVTTTRQGKFVVYKLADNAVLALLSSLRKISEHNSAEVERLVRNYFDKLDSLEPVTRKELMRRLRSGGVMVLDVRPEDEFSLGHLPGAMNVPLRELKTRLSKLKRSQEIIAYCRGPYCVLSYEAVAALRRLGFKARRLEDGLPEWRAAGLPVVTGKA